MRTFPALVFATILGFASLAHGAAPDLTGTWTGKLACKGISTSPFLFGAFNFIDKEATLKITQVDEGLLASLDATDPDYPFPLMATMCGPVLVNPAKPKQVRAGLVAGDGGPGAAFAVDFSSVKVFPVNGKGVTGKLKGRGVIISGGFFVALAARGGGIRGGISGSCKWTFERTNDMPPADPPMDCGDGMPM